MMFHIVYQFTRDFTTPRRDNLEIHFSQCSQRMVLSDQAKSVFPRSKSIKSDMNGANRNNLGSRNLYWCFLAFSVHFEGVAFAKRLFCHVVKRK